MISCKLNLFSNTLSIHSDCRILLPDGCHRDTKIPVLWLCHGGNGDENEWLYHSSIAEISDEAGIAAVLVNAEDSCFVDMVYGKRFSAWIGEELPQILYRMFPVMSSAREDNYICGLSNGGYGSLLIGLSYPERFGAVGAFSAGDKADARYVPAKDGEITPRIRIYGQEDIRDTRYSIRALARSVSFNSSMKPLIYHACGQEDPWLDLNILFKDTMTELNDPAFCYVYEEMEGYGHEWKFWDTSLRRFLDYLNQSLPERKSKG